MDEYSDSIQIEKIMRGEYPAHPIDRIMHGMDEKSTVNHRRALLSEAAEITSRDRATAYGKPEDNFKDISTLWDAYLRGKQTISSMDVVILNILQKVARLKFNPTHHDSLVDIAGYAACGADIQEAIRSVIPGLGLKVTENGVQPARREGDRP